MRKLLLLMTMLLLSVGQGAWADDVKYIERSWDAASKTLKHQEKTVNATPLSAVKDENGWRNLADGWYYVDKDLTIVTLNIYGADVKLILKNGTTLTCNGGVKLIEGHKLTIYGQTEGDTDDSQGKLVATWSKSYEHKTGIGSNFNDDFGELVVHGGVISANSGKHSPGIGSGYIDSIKGRRYGHGAVTIYGGKLTTQGGENGAGIGGGSAETNSDDLYSLNPGVRYVQYGGEVVATGGELAAGIGGGGPYSRIGKNIESYGSSMGQVRIYGGKLTAQGGRRAAGIGSSSHVYSRKVMLTSINEKDTMIVYGGEVYATGGDYGAGIGGGCNAQGVILIVEGGLVRAVGRKTGAGIGGGEDGPGHYCRVTGGTVMAIAGDECHGDRAADGSAIGSGQGQKVKDNGEHNMLVIGDATHPMKVTAGADEYNAERVFTAGERVAACHWRNAAKIEVCYHNDANPWSYTQLDDKQHSKYCRYCATTITEAHDYKDGRCACGREGTNPPEPWTIRLWTSTDVKNLAYGNIPKEYKVARGQKFTIPVVDAPEGLEFMGWWQDPPYVPDGSEMYDEDLPNLKNSGTEIDVTKDVNLFARYRLAHTDVWTWADDHLSATVTITFADGTVDDDIKATVTSEIVQPTETMAGYTRFIASAESRKNDLIHYYATDHLDVDIFNSLKLKDAADNSDLLKKFNGQCVNVTYNRKLKAGKTKDGKWRSRAYTVCLPYDLDLSGYGDQVKVYTLSEVDRDKKLFIFSSDYPFLKKGESYVVVVKSGTVSLDAQAVDVTYYEADDKFIPAVGRIEGDDAVGRWIGAFAPQTMSSLVERGYIIQTNGTFKRVTSEEGKPLPSFRAYFYALQEMDADVYKTKFINVTNGEGDTTEEIIDEFADEFEVADDEASAISGTRSQQTSQSVYYDLQGRRHDGRPAKGLYIRNGQKVIVR